MSINIRQAIDDDVQAIADMIMEMWLMHTEKAPVVLDKEYIENMDAVGWIRECMAKDGDFWFVAELNGEVVGCISCEIQDKQGMYASNPMLYIDDLMVKDSARGQGVARQLIKKCLDVAKEKKIDVVDAKIYDFNKEAQAVFNKLGFKSEHRQFYKKIY